MTSGQPIQIIVVAPDGVLRTSIVSLLRAIPAVCIVAQTSQTTMLADMVCALCADVLMLDADLCGASAEALVRQLCERRPALNIIVCSDNLRQLEQLRVAGAHHVLLKGFRSANLVKAVLDRTLGE